jgi:hypothetical protein
LSVGVGGRRVSRCQLGCQNGTPDTSQVSPSEERFVTHPFVQLQWTPGRRTLAVVDGPPKCSFCGKSQTQVKKLIAGPSVHICNECVALCDDILAEEGVTRDETNDLYDAGYERAVLFDQTLACLEPRERQIIWFQFGLDRGKPRTPEEVGAIITASLRSRSARS